MIQIEKKQNSCEIIFDNGQKIFTLTNVDDISQQILINHFNKINPTLKYDNDLCDIDEVLREVEIAFEHSH